MGKLLFEVGMRVRYRRTVMRRFVSVFADPNNRRGTVSEVYTDFVVVAWDDLKDHTPNARVERKVVLERDRRKVR